MDRLDLVTKTLSVYPGSFAVLRLHHFPKAQELLPEGTLEQKAESDQKFHSTFSCFSFEGQMFALFTANVIQGGQPLPSF